MDRKVANNSPIYKNSTKRSRDMLRGEGDILRQGKTSSFIIMENFSLVKQI